nr:MAG TPA: hypothetical protein [Caudoviricetes sp.]DAF65966.1 MAG TPA: hypothetical protein [Caudoviricetes sp.]DAH40551.1 MAG TPA: hypothetical protein [Caudoviricetes sp.]DAL17349.1 MAG TPA_asm: hypothetical protein [Caudoviricetes sp.]
MNFLICRYLANSGFKITVYKMTYRYLVFNNGKSRR